jgi:hypothetical protein
VPAERCDGGHFGGDRGESDALDLCGAPIRIVVGIGGGVPSEEHNIRLDDLVVSKPGGKSGGVVQYDFGKTVQEGRFVQMGSLSRPPNVLLSAVASLQAKHMLEDADVSKHLSEMMARYPKLRAKSTYQGVENDHWSILDRGFGNNPIICTDMKCEATLRRLLVAVACYMSTLHECSPTATTTTVY